MADPLGIGIDTDFLGLLGDLDEDRIFSYSWLFPFVVGLYFTLKAIGNIIFEKDSQGESGV